jgi:hypothetical protein
LYADRNYWQEPWTQRTQLSQRVSSQVSALPRVRPVQFAPNRRRPVFDFSTTIVPANEIHSGGPPKDGIPALTNPRFIAARGANYLRLSIQETVTVANTLQLNLKISKVDV